MKERKEQAKTEMVTENCMQTSMKRNKDTRKQRKK